MSYQTYSKAIDQYMKSLNDANLDGILALYADDATLEDPVGTLLIKGLEAIRVFYGRAILAKPSVQLTGPVRVAGKEAAFSFEIKINMADNLTTISVIDVFRFNDEGKVISMRAFWGPENNS